MGHLVAPIFDCSAVFHAGEPVLVLSALFAERLNGGWVRWRVMSLHDLADANGLRILDDALDSDHWITGAIAVCGANGVTMDFGGGGLQVERMQLPSREWLDAVRELRRTRLIVTVPRRRRRQDLSWLLRHGRGFGGLVEAVEVDVSRWQSRFQFLGGSGLVQPRPQSQTVILDSSVLVDLERAASGRGDPGLVAAAQHLVLQIIHMDVLPGPAIAELVHEREGTRFNSRRGESLAAAANAWFDGGVARASSIEAVRAAFDESLVAGPHLDLTSQEHDLTQQAFYASLLKLASLWLEGKGRFRARQRVELYKEFMRWMVYDLGVVCTLPLQVARDRLVGPQGCDAAYTDQLMKFSGRLLDDLWGASWDLTHLAAIDLVQAGNLLDIGGRQVVLVTADKALVQLRSRVLDLRHVVALDHGSMPLKLVRAKLDDRIRDHADAIARMHQTLNDAVVHRQNTEWERPTVSQISQQTRALEAMLVEKG